MINHWRDRERPIVGTAGSMWSWLCFGVADQRDPGIVCSRADRGTSRNDGKSGQRHEPDDDKDYRSQLIALTPTCPNTLNCLKSIDVACKSPPYLSCDRLRRR